MKREYVSTGGIYTEGYVRPILPFRKMSKNESFERNGYLFLPGFIQNPELLYEPPLVYENGKRITGVLKYTRKDKFQFISEDNVKGALARYNIPKYKELHFLVKKAIEEILGMDLHPSYFFDRFYFAGHHLTRHVDRHACEVSVTLQLNTNNPDNPWPIWFDLPDGSEKYVLMKDGDAVIYKGCEREHWRDALPSKYNKTQKFWRKVRKLPDDTYHHQIFLHYVDANGPFVHCAFDAIKH